MRVAIQGVEGSYHHIAAESYFGRGAELVCCDTFAAVFAALENNKADAAVAGAENSIAGTVHPVYDLLLRDNFFITGEVYEQIHHCLIGLPGAEISKITKVFSHPMALPQCEEFIAKYLPNTERIEYNDTAASVKHIKDLGNIKNAAIASSLAAELHELPVIEENIEDYPNNVTRFLILKQAHDVPNNANKSSCVLETPHKPGGLFQALGVMAKAQINLTKLESRPVPDKPWRYQFLIDVESAGTKLHDAVKQLENIGCNVRVLGEYKAGVKTSS